MFEGDLLSPIPMDKDSLMDPLPHTGKWKMFEGDLLSPIPMDKDSLMDPLPHTPPIVPTSLGAASNSTPQGSFKTPNKVGGSVYHSQQFQTPTARFANRLQQASPCLHTPNGNGGHFKLKTPGSGQGISMGSGQRATPRFRTPSSSSRARECILQTTPKFLHTPTGMVYNPFESHQFEQLGEPVFSPSVFDGNYEESSPQSFRWSIDQLAILKPADIEENAVQEDMCIQSENPELEERAQKAIDAFFSNQYIVPSPWTDSKKPTFELPRTPGNESVGSPMIFSGCGKEKRVQSTKKDACCQTALTLPADFDLEKVLGEHYTQTEQMDSTTPTDDLSPSELLSTSSLRRKLFFHGDENSPPSPACYKENDPSPKVSPVKAFTPSHLPKIPAPSPASGHFSSSPISAKHMTPSIRRCSQMQPSDGMTSPQLSPIGLQLDDMDTAATPLTRPMQGTPSTGHQTPFDIPAMSPIKSGSYIESPERSCRPDAFTTVSQTPCLASPFHPSTFMKEDIERQFSPIFKQGTSKAQRKEYLIEKLSTSAMSIPEAGTMDIRRSLDCEQSFHKSPEVTDLKRPLSIPRDFEFGDHDESASQDPALNTYFMGSDTGYNTNSLQLTNQDTTSQSGASNATGSDGALHSNLTNQFGSLPFNAQDTGVDFHLEPSVSDLKSEQYYNAQYFMKNVPKGLELSGSEAPEPKPVRNPRFGQLNFDEVVEPALNQEEVIRRARRALALNSGDHENY